jgi:hypothetical protein
MSKSLKKVTNIPVPNLIRFENGEIVDILYVKNYNITKNDAIKFLGISGSYKTILIILYNFISF